VFHVYHALWTCNDCLSFCIYMCLILHMILPTWDSYYYYYCTVWQVFLEKLIITVLFITVFTKACPQLNSIHILTLHFFRIYFHVIFPPGSLIFFILHPPPPPQLYHTWLVFYITATDCIIVFSVTVHSAYALYLSVMVDYQHSNQTGLLGERNAIILQYITHVFKVQ
jgi:hypothetical protein